MKLLIIILLFLITENFLFGQKNENCRAYHPQYKEIFNANFHFPESASIKGVDGFCVVKFRVLITGEIVDFTIIQKVPNCPECDEEFIRVLRLMKNWIPATIDGKVVESEYTAKLKFSTY